MFATAVVDIRPSTRLTAYSRYSCRTMFWEKGYDGASLSELTKAMGMRRLLHSQASESDERRRLRPDRGPNIPKRAVHMRKPHMNRMAHKLEVRS